MNSNEWTWVFWGLERAQSVWCAIVCACVCVCVGGGLFNLCVTPPKFLACSRCDKVRFRRQPGRSWQYNFPFYFSACASRCRWSSLYKSCVHPFVSAQPRLSSNCPHGEQIDWALSLILPLRCRSEVGGRMRHNGSDRLRPIAKHQKPQAGRQATQTRALTDPADPIFQRSGGKHGDGINHLESEILSWSMEPSTGKFTVATSAPVVCNVAALSSANWHFSLHKSPQKKETPSRSTLWGLSKSQSKWPGCSH